MNNKFKSFFFYCIPLIFIILSFIPIMVLSIYPHLKQLLLVISTVLLLLTSFTICGQILFLSIDAKNNNKLILIFPLFILNILYVPFYYSKYIEKKYSRIPVFMAIFNVCIIGIIITLLYSFSKPEKDLYYKVLSDDKLINVNFPKSFNKCNYSDVYALECYDQKNNLTTMIVNYKYDEINYENKLSNIVTSYADILKEKDDTIEKVSSPTLTSINNKDIYQVIYKGTSKGIKYNYILSSILYPEKDIISLTIQVVEINNYKTEKDKLNDILKSIMKKI